MKLKDACTDGHPYQPTFFQIMEILVPEVESYLGGLMCEVAYVQT